MENKNQNELFWNASYQEIKNGFVEADGKVTCLLCGQEYVMGEIYPWNEKFYDARKMVEIHIEENHKSVLDYILNMNSTFLGISEIQHDIIELFALGLSDKEIAEKKGISASTIRNYRFKFREKEKQAKLFLALMELLEAKSQKGINVLANTKLCDANKTANMIDDRYNTTEDEKKKILETYFKKDGALKEYPSREKRKLIVLDEINKNFKVGKKYSEQEINTILKRIYEDFPYIRRALVEYGFLVRTKSGEEYWVKE
ncbi:DUF2087 domain-containing protein [Anaeromicropila herbilytica]|uniref:Transcriptional regulator n=1 Tax=Anaeromicropila herbilytica TaxID=2785025 RepID=A0A7R7IDS6_9FIRM|nr:DUF2087 domain-containing protein [Anaeromicropila herbilytica]BCN31266.1 transcriptional regulator [Anaeromicropila herbilytica]